MNQGLRVEEVMTVARFWKIYGTALSRIFKHADSAETVMTMSEKDVRDAAEILFKEDLRKSLDFRVAFRQAKSTHCETIKYCPDRLEKGLQPILDDYEKIGEACRRDPLIQESISEFKSTVQAISETPLDTPFVFICGSSGMGKTQLPFTLNIPCIYFHYNMSGDYSQEIYRVFHRPSQEFKKCCKTDQLEYQDQDYNMDSFNIDFKSWAVGFLVSYWKAICHNKTDDLTWTRAQIIWPAGSLIYYQKKSLREAKYEISAISTEYASITDKQPPCVFIDIIDEANNFDSKEISFLRTLIRRLGVPLALMGTTANAVNYCQSTVRENSRSSSSREKPWCYLIHKLPPTSRLFLEETYFKHIREKLSKRLDKESLAYKQISDLVDLFSRILHFERPLFSIQTAKLLNDYVDKNLQNFKTDSGPLESSICEFLERLLSKLYQDFVDKKRAYKSENFRYAQLCFMGPRSEKDMWPACYINQHLASLCVTGTTDIKDFKTRKCLYIGVDDKRIEYSSTEVALTLCYYDGFNYHNFLGRSSMPEFGDSLITGLSFSGPMMAIQDTFVIDKHQTALQATLKFYEWMPGQMCEDQIRLDGHFLERLAETALIMASHAKGLQNHEYNFRQMLPNFIRQLQYHMSESTPEIDFETHKSRWDIFEQEYIPYCATSGGQWTNYVTSYFTDRLNVRVGTIERKKDDNVDIRVYDQRRVQKLALEAKLDVRKVSSYSIGGKTELDLVKKADSNIFVTAKRPYSVLMSVGESDYDESDEKAAYIANKLSEDSSENDDKAKIFIFLATQWANIKLSSPSNQEKKPKLDNVNKKQTLLIDVLNQQHVWLVKLVKINNNASQDLGYKFQEWHVPTHIKRVAILVELAQTIPEVRLDEVKKFC